MTLSLHKTKKDELQLEFASLLNNQTMNNQTMK